MLAVKDRVGPGASRLFTFTLAAGGAGTRDTQWRLIPESADGVTNIAPDALATWGAGATGQYDAAFESYENVPTAAPWDIPLEAAVHLRNTGTKAWLAQDPRTGNPVAYHLVERVSGTGGRWRVTEVPVPDGVAPGAAVRVPLAFWTPVPEPGVTEATYPFRWQLMRTVEGEAPAAVGEPTPVRQIRLSATAEDPRFRAHAWPLEVPDVSPGDVVLARATFENAGTETWRAGVVRLQRDEGTAAWGPATLALPTAAVAPGTTVRFTVAVPVPLEACADRGPGEACVYRLAYGLAHAAEGTWTPFGDHAAATVDLGVDSEPDRVLSYYHLDGLGSVRVVTDADGQVARACDTGVEVGRHEFLPFGEPPSLTPSGEGGSARATAGQGSGTARARRRSGGCLRASRLRSRGCGRRATASQGNGTSRRGWTTSGRGITRRCGAASRRSIRSTPGRRTSSTRSGGTATATSGTTR